MVNVQYRRILVPLDGSKLAEQVLPHAMKVAKSTSAEVVLMHVVPASGQMRRPPTPAQKTAMDDIGAYLKKVSASLSKQEKLEVGWRVSCGDPVDDLVRFVHDGDVDLVAICTHGKGADGQTDLGSVALELLNKVTVPLLVFRPGGPVSKD